MMFSMKAAIDQLQAQVRDIAQTIGTPDADENPRATQKRKLPTAIANISSAAIPAPTTEAPDTTTAARPSSIKRVLSARPMYLKTRSDSGVMLINQQEGGGARSPSDTAQTKLPPLRRMRSFIPFTSGPKALTSQTPFTDQLFQR